MKTLLETIMSFLGSEKGILAIVLLVAASIMTGLDKMTIAEWREYTLWVAGIYTGGKAIQGAASCLSPCTCDVEENGDEPSK